MNSFNYCTIYVLYYTIKVVVYFCNFIQKIKTSLAIKLEWDQGRVSNQQRHN